MPIARWRPAALIEGLRRSIPIVGGDPDALSREQRKDVMAVLKDRGYDVEALIKFGFAYDISGSVGAMLMARHMFSDHVEEIEEFFEGQSENLQRWAHLLGMPEVESRKPGDLRSVSSDHDIVKLLLGRDGPISLLRWVHWANLDDVLEVRAPSSFIFPDHDLGDSETALRALWIRDRFVSTYLRDWHTSSLAMEWRYLFGQCSAPCAPYEMANRHVTPDELAPMLADYAAGQFDQNQRRGELVADRYVPVAKRLLEEGRRADAAAIFEAISTAQPHDGTALNNWGFCLLPDDPERALELLDSASKSSPGRLLIVANRLNALIRLRRFTSALDLAELVLPTIVGSAVEPCMLWSFSAGDELEKCDDVRHYVLNAIDVTLNSVDDASLNEQWAPKLAEVRRSISTLTDAS